jgi:hypothetical protein
MEDVVRVIVVPSETEAEVVCGLLRTAGLECAHRPTAELDSAVEGFDSSSGPHEVLVRAEHAEEARAVIESARPV